jgi:hypothetical protein
MPEETSASREAINRLGLNPDNLGCVMLEVHMPDDYRVVLDPEWEYHSPKLEYVKGYEGDAHVTLLYGLLTSAEENKDLVDQVLETWHKPNLLVFPDVEAFPGDDGHEMYSAIVLTMEHNDWDSESLEDANGRLRRLPHVNGFPEYKPHVTVGYVLKPYTELALERVREVLVRPFRTGDLEYT